MKKIVKVLKVVGKIADGALLGGVITNVKEATEESPKGKVDWVKLIGAAIPLIIVIYLLAGGDMEVAKQALKAF